VPAALAPQREPRLSYPDHLSVRAARALYFERNGFGESVYDDRWVKLRAGPVPLWFPNTDARRAAVKLHDLHHAASGYETTWTGEAEIAAWEIASGCAHHHAAWVLNAQALGIGMLIAPGALLRAFVRGRHSRNLYRTQIDDALLDAPLGALRHRLGLDREPPPARPGDVLRFAAWGAIGVSTVVLTAALLLLPMAGVARLAAWAAGW
jgi:hypothetical protein